MGKYNKEIGQSTWKNKSRLDQNVLTKCANKKMKFISEKLNVALSHFMLSDMADQVQHTISPSLSH